MDDEKVLKNIYLIFRLESNLIGLLQAIEKIDDVCEQSALTGDPIYKENIQPDVYEGSDIYELEYAVYQIRRYIADSIKNIEDLKAENLAETGKEHSQLLREHSYYISKMLFKDHSVNRLIEFDKEVDSIKEDNEFFLKNINGKKFEKIDKEMEAKYGESEDKKLA